MLKKFFREISGNFALTTAILSVPLMGAVGLAVDYSVFVNQKFGMQEAADGAVLAAAREASLNNWDRSVVEGTVDQYIDAALAGAGFTSRGFKSSVSVDGARKTVSVKMAQDGDSYFLLGLLKGNPIIEIQASASFTAAASTCAIALDEADPYAFAMTGLSSITAVNCALYSNSISSSGMHLVRNAKMSSSHNCTSGGYSGRLMDISPPPITDCPPMNDPLASRVVPTASGCQETNLFLVEVNANLDPGTYCGGLVIDEAQITLKPGVYIIKDGPFIVRNSAVVRGENVGLIFEGDKSTFDFGPDTTISLAAPKDGPMAGILFYEGGNAPLGREFVIRSMSAEKLVGTIYLPRGKFVADKASRIGQQSDWTAIIANKIEIRRAPISFSIPTMPTLRFRFPKASDQWEAVWRD